MGVRRTEELEILKEVCRRLERSGILYRITGSIASNLYAIPRMTRDIDIVIQIKREDSAKLIEIFRDDFYIKLDSMTEAVEECGLFHIIHSRLGPRPWPGDRSRSTRPGPSRL